MSVLGEHLDLITDGYWDWDLKNPEYEYMSPKFWRTFGYDPDTKKHSPDEWQNLIHPEDLTKATEAFHEHVSQGTPYHLLVRYRHLDGHWVWIICRGQVLYADDGTLDRMIGSHQDVTESVKRLSKDPNIRKPLDSMADAMTRIIDRLEKGV